jgi:CHAT domain-containing protein
VIETGDKNCEAFVYMNLGDAYAMSGKHHESIKYYQKSLLMAKEIGSKSGEGKAYGGLGNSYLSLIKYEDAIQCFLKCLEITKETGEKEMEGSANHNLGSLYMRLSNHYYAKRDVDEVINCLEKAERCLRDSVLCYEWLFDHLQDEDQLKISIVDTFIQTHDYLTAVLIRSLKADEALLLAERGRARALGDLLMVKYGVTNRNDTRKNFLTDVDIETILSNRKFCVLFFAMASVTYVAAWHLSHCSKSHHIEPIKSFNSAAHKSPLEKCQEDRVQIQLNQLVESSYDKMKVREAGTNCEDRSLVLLDNVVNAKEHSFVQGKRSESDENNNPKRMTQNSDAYRCIPDEDLDDNIDPLPVLYNGLMAHIKCSHCPQDELVIVPFGALWTVPFAALRDPNTGLFLSETKRIRLAPSLTSLKVLQESSTDYHSKTGALIIGNPHVGEVMFRGKAKHLNDLPCAEKEAEKIGKLLDVKPFIGKQATKGTILENLREGVAVIHFAAHGTTEGEIALTPSVTSGIPQEHDYILTIKEVQESGIRPQLVVLSCCHSGRGEIKAEGVIGMSRAFLAAGARAVVASLWAIDDQATMIFMEKFYSHLSGGESASVSLQKAMKGMRETEQYNEPRYWAPFFLIGDDVKIDFGGNGSK